MTENAKLNDGRKIPPIGMGTYKVVNLPEIIKAGLSIGYRLIDTARLYNNEGEIGKCLSNIFNEGIIRREDLFVVSKLQNVNHRPHDVIPAVKKSLADLQLEYLDLYLIHWPVACEPTENEIETSNFIEDKGVTLEETWCAMEECVKLGYAKSIGVSNFNSVQIDRICKICTIKPVVNQVECNPYFCPKKLIKFCNDRDIAIMAYSPLYRPGRYALMLLEEPILKQLADKHHRSAAQIVFRYLIQLGVIPVTMSSNPQHLKEDFNVFDFSLSEEDIQMIEKIHRNLRCNVQERFQNFKEYPFAIEF